MTMITKYCIFPTIFPYEHTCNETVMATVHGELPKHGCHVVTEVN